jgi:hypothetical protein
MERRFDETKLSERPTKMYEYYVSGRGDFPFDMLRYDAAWPASGEDAAKLERDGELRSKVRSVRLRSYREPTIDRWLSFLWSVGRRNIS